MNETETKFFICPTCFAVSEKVMRCHGHQMIPCNADNPEDCKPLMDSDGFVKTRAPRWFIDASKKLNN